MKAAVDSLGAQVVAGHTRLQTRAVVVQGLVAAVEEGAVVLNVGAGAGVVRVIDVDDASAIAAVVSGTIFRVGDTFKTIQP